MFFAYDKTGLCSSSEGVIFLFLTGGHIITQIFNTYFSFYTFTVSNKTGRKFKNIYFWYFHVAPMFKYGNYISEVSIYYFLLKMYRGSGR